jgi:hypothetical protein
MDVWSDSEKRKNKWEIRNRLGIMSVSYFLRQGRLRWFGYVECKHAEDWVSACRNRQFQGKEVEVENMDRVRGI